MCQVVIGKKQKLIIKISIKIYIVAILLERFKMSLLPSRDYLLHLYKAISSSS